MATAANGAQFVMLSKKFIPGSPDETLSGPSTPLHRGHSSLIAPFKAGHRDFKVMVSIAAGALACTKNSEFSSPPGTLNLGSLRFPIRKLAKQFAARASEAEIAEMAEPAEVETRVASPESFPADARAFTHEASARIVVVVGVGTVSPFGGTLWEDVMRHMARRISWIDPSFQMLVFSDNALPPGGPLHSDLTSALGTANILLGVSVQSTESIKWLGPCMGAVQTAVCFESATELAPHMRLGGIDVGQLGRPARVAASLGIWPEGAERLKTLKLVTESWARHNADDVWFSALALVNAYVTPVAMLQSLRAKDFKTLQCMVGNCGSQIAACLANPDCRAALDCLTSCGPTDQVCSYRCIVSYESPELEAFSLCILQRHNCLGLSAEIRSQPVVAPLPTFRGQPLTHELGEDLLIGWLGEDRLPYSWRVVAGQNAAYDQFPCQYQIFYRGKGKRSFWYDPVFQVQTLDGRVVWRRRHYRVRRRELPGTFTFSVLDNGVTSTELWTIVQVADDLSWGLLFYSGAAAAAGQSYMGAVLVSKDSLWPAPEHEASVNAALELCGIQVWELFRVHNGACQGAPLGLPQDTPIPESSIAL